MGRTEAHSIGEFPNRMGSYERFTRHAILWGLALGMTVVFITPLGYGVPVPTNNPFFK